jgi:DNA (cytosine-5)-methyltransferase 1
VRFGSVCSGIEAASVAWHPLGWKAAWLSEIELFPSAVLAHHYPDVPNLGDMITLPERILSNEVEAPDLFCGGTPCQAFSVAGLRNSLDDARGNLSLTFVGIANAIDHVRSVRSAPPAIVFWENVPGVLSTKDNAFGCFLAALAGEDDPIIPSGEKWTNAGCVYGPQRAVAWRVLDAQYFGVAQRRRRVFVVASARADFDPAAVLFQFDGVRRDSAPSRKTGQSIAACVTNGPPFSRTGNERVEAEAMVVQPYEVGNCLTARMHKGINSTLDEGQTPVISIQDVNTAPSREKGQAIAPTLDRAQPAAVAQPIPINTMVALRHEALGEGTGFGIADAGDPSYTLTKGHSHAVAQPIASNIAPGKSELKDDIHVTDAHISKTIDASGSNPAMHQGGAAIVQTMAVRRLTPVECERLQGFPDGYTNIPWRKKLESPDGPRYKALGNSWAVPVVRWIGHRIQQELNK